MLDPLPDRPRKGRGAVSNPTGRYEAQTRVAFDDGWSEVRDDRPPEPIETRVGIDSSRSVIARNKSPDVPFEQSINPYRGCEHGCVYCFARPTHAWLGLSPGLDFETRIFAKPDAAKRLEAELGRPGYRAETIALGANTDPYQPVERSLKITRGLLEVLWRTRHPVAIVTKSNLILRDLDLLAPMAEARLARVFVSVTTLDPALARRMEPRAPTPARRLSAIEGLARGGVPVGVLAAPMIPALNDAELERILEASAGAGATSAGYVLLRLPLEIKHLFLEWLEAHYPDRKAKILGLLREARDGKLYDAAWGKRMKGGGPYAELLAQRFKLACKRYGLDRREWELDAGQFLRPGAETRQLDLF
ncbi:MAG TPA: PA0069 family radical SAM protein [Kiloniellales bacterium]|nr:PA0069 family radical SAM protein [Kiloniellales bacterium]